MVGACAAVLALAGLGAGTAFAEEEVEYPLTGLPEIGRCVKVTLGTGHFNFPNCVGHDKDGNDGSYNWKPGPSSTSGKGTIKFHMGAIKLETVGGKKIQCSGGNLIGGIVDGKKVKIAETEFVGCTNVQTGKSCYSSFAEPSKITSTSALEGEIGFITNPKNPSNPFVGVDLANETEGLPVLTFNCGEQLASEAYTLEGSVIAKIGKRNKMLTSNGFSYTQTLGHQNPESFIGFPKDVLTEVEFPIVNPLEKTSEQVGLSTAGELATGEAIEFKAKQL
jgi:hypothetical protein